MMGFESAVDLLKKFANAIQGTLIANENFKMVKVFKDDILLEYQFGGRDSNPAFVFAMPLSFFIKFSASNHKPVVDTFVGLLSNRIKSIKDYTVYGDDTAETNRLLEAVFNDYEYTACLSELKNWTIEANNRTLLVYRKKSIDPLFSVKDRVTCEELLHMYDILKETRETLEFHKKRM